MDRIGIKVDGIAIPADWINNTVDGIAITADRIDTRIHQLHGS